MPGRSLYQMAKTACIRNKNSINDVGDIPYDHVRPILLKIENPDQLAQLEKASPQLIGPSAELWKRFIKRDITSSSSSKPPEPKNPASWYKLYRKLLADDASAIARQELELKAQLSAAEAELKSRKSMMVDPSTVPKLPRMGGMRVEKARGAGPVARKVDTSSLHFSSGSKTKTVTGQGVINKARREAREMSLFSAKKSVLATPTHQLANRATQLSAAPRGLVDGHRRGPGLVDGKVEVKRTMIMVPRKGANQGLGSAGLDTKEREKKSNSAQRGEKRGREDDRAESVIATPLNNMSQPRQTTPQPVGGYRVPRLTVSPDGRPKVKAPVDIFMPTKRRRVR